MRYDDEGLMVRNCFICDAEITRCFGFTLGRDFSAALDGAPIFPREMCGRCVNLPDHMKWFAIAYTMPLSRDEAYSTG